MLKIKIMHKIILGIIFLSLISCGGGGGNSSTAEVLDNPTEDNEVGILDNDTTAEPDTPLESDTPIESEESVVGTVIVSEEFPFTGTGSAPIESIGVVASNGQEIAFAANYTTSEGETSALWLGDVDNPMPVITTGISLPIPSGDNQFASATFLDYFDDGTLGMWFDRTEGGAGFLTLDGTNAFGVLVTGITLQGVIEPRLVDSIARVSHSGARNLIVGRTEDIGNLVLWQIEGTDITPIASTYNQGISSRFTEDNCGVTLLGRDFALGTANGEVPIVGLSESGDALFLAQLSNEFSGCNEEGLAIVRYRDGIYTSLVTTPTSMIRALSLRRVFPDGSFIFSEFGTLMTYTQSGDIVDVDPAFLGFSELDFEQLDLTAESWANRPASLSADTEFFLRDIEAIGTDGSVVFEASFRSQSDDTLSDPALWLYKSSGEVSRLVSDERLVQIQGEGRRVVASRGYEVEYYNPNNFVLVRVSLGDRLGNPGDTEALLRIDLQ